MKRLTIKLLRNENGAVAILFAFAMVVLLGVSALAVDVAHLHLKKAEMQNAADAAALAGVLELPDADNARDKAEEIADSNGVDISNITVTTPYDGDSTKIEVIVTARDVPHFFATVWGRTETDVPARAVAQRETGEGDAGPAIMANKSSGSDPIIQFNAQYINVIGTTYTNGLTKFGDKPVTLDGDLEVVNGAEDLNNATVNGDIYDDSDSDPTNDVDEILSFPTFQDDIGLDDGTPNNGGGDQIDAVYAEPGRERYTNKKDPYEINGNKNNSVILEHKNSYVLVKGGTLVEGSIIANGKNSYINLNHDNVQIGTPANPVLVYSNGKDDAIQINNKNTTIYGTVYAPRGKVKIDAEGVQIFGRIIAQEVEINDKYVTVDGSSLGGGGTSGNVHLIE